MSVVKLLRALPGRVALARFMADAICLAALMIGAVTHAGVPQVQNVKATSFSFNALHQLSSATLPDGTRIDYTYGADGNISGRSRTPTGGTKSTVHYLVDPTAAFPQIVAEFDDAGHAIATFEYGGDELLARLKDGVQTFYVHDGHGSVIALTDIVVHLRL